MNILRIILVVGGLAWATPLLASGSTAWVRQTDLKTNLTYDTPIVEPTSPYTSTLRVNESGSLYQLYAKGTAWDNNIYLLDSKVIGAYNPVASVTITTEDTYCRGDPASGTCVRRTRADRPFTVDCNVSGLVVGSTDPSNGTVKFSISTTSYDPQTYSGLNQPQPPPPPIYTCGLANGAVHLPTQLTSPTLTTGCGSQSYNITRNAGYGVPATTLVQPSIEIWPVATAAVTVVTPNFTFIDRIPTVVVTMSNVYPDSRTYAQVYPGPSVLGTVGTLIAGTERLVGLYYNPTQVAPPTNVPQNYTISVSNLSTYAAADGIYTVEVITQTPFARAGERLLSTTFQVDRVISSRAQITSAEKTSP